MGAAGGGGELAVDTKKEPERTRRKIHMLGKTKTIREKSTRKAKRIFGNIPKGRVEKGKTRLVLSENRKSWRENGHRSGG